MGLRQSGSIAADPPALKGQPLIYHDDLYEFSTLDPLRRM